MKEYKIYYDNFHDCWTYDIDGEWSEVESQSVEDLEKYIFENNCQTKELPYILTVSYLTLPGD